MAGYNEAKQEEDLVYRAVHSGWFPVTLTRRELPEKYKWQVAVNTGDPKCQFFHKNSMPTVESKIFLGERSVIILILLSYELKFFSYFSIFFRIFLFVFDKSVDCIISNRLVIF